jgi:ELWxxDGT repeat protein
VGFPNPLNQGLYRSDGTEAGTTFVKQIIGLRNLTEANGTLYFGGAGDDPTFKIGLWRSDGTAAGTTNIKEGVVPTEITDVNGTLYLAVADGALTGLWRSDGTEAGTELVKAIIDPAGPEGRDLPQDLTDVNGTLYFLASSAINFSETRELWRSDGTEAGTTEVKQINLPSALGGLGIDHDLTAYKGNVYFTAGGALWRSDGTPRGTTLIKGTCSPKAGPRLRCFSGLTSTGPNGSLYLAGTDKKYGGELWRSNGTRKGTKIVTDIRRGRDSSLPMYLTAINHTLFFAAKDGKHGRELWKVKPGPCKKAKGKCKKG